MVVDASVLATALVDGGVDGDVARHRMAMGAPLAAPDVADVETVSVLRKHWIAGSLTAPRFRSALDDLAALPIVRYPTLHFMPRAYQLRDNLTPYDAAYVALAEGLGCPLVTADGRLARAPGIRCEVDLVRPTVDDPAPP